MGVRVGVWSGRLFGLVVIGVGLGILFEWHFYVVLLLCRNMALSLVKEGCFYQPSQGSAKIMYFIMIEIRYSTHC